MPDTLDLISALVLINTKSNSQGIAAACLWRALRKSLLA